LADALSELPQTVHPDLLVGYNTADDAGVFRISENQALVQTVDFFPPIVDDPYQFGQIAAANALSDIYAMGGRPITALNIVGFPVSTLPSWVLTEVLRGGSEKIAESGAVLVGGHSIKDKELKYGVSVTGLIDPKRIITNAGAQIGDLLFLTKALGTGIISTGIKRNLVSDELTALVITQMAALNKTASELMIEHKATASTDITGFGLLGHACEMANGSGHTIRIFAGALPILPDALRLASEGVLTGGSNDNREFLQEKVSLASSLEQTMQEILYDPQTSGGLLIAIPADRAKSFRDALKKNNLPDKVVGRIERRETQQASLIIVESGDGSDIGAL